MNEAHYGTYDAERWGETSHGGEHTLPNLVPLLERNDLRLEYLSDHLGGCPIDHQADSHLQELAGVLGHLVEFGDHAVEFVREHQDNGEQEQLMMN